MNKSKSAIIADKFIHNKRFKVMVSECRKGIGIPMGGFKDENTREVWFDKVTGRETDAINRLIREVKRGFPIIRYSLNTSDFSISLIRFLINGLPSAFDNLDVSGCDVEILNRRNEKRYTLGDGIYIKIGIYATVADVMKFTKKKWDFIQLAMRDLKKEKGLPKKRERIRRRTKEGRDFIVWYLSRMSNQEMRNWLEVDAIPLMLTSKYKDINIAKVVNAMGHKITPENVRKIISTQKKLRE